ncbi:MAG: DUF126 domain-containing protein [Methanosarcinaceae archaeon]|nr:DUF126 domain-containing protein [Methanosarcinaceae archaeon]
MSGNKNTNSKRIKGRTISRGCAEGEVLLIETPISFLGGVNSATGEITDKESKHDGVSVAGKILVFPSGKGSTVGSYVMYQLKKNKKAPAAIINTECETIVAVGAIISEIPLLDKTKEDPFDILENGDRVIVNATEGWFEIKK